MWDDSRFQRNLNRTCIQRIETVHETWIRSKNTRASVYALHSFFSVDLTSDLDLAYTNLGY